MEFASVCPARKLKRSLSGVSGPVVGADLWIRVLDSVHEGVTPWIGGFVAGLLERGGYRVFAMLARVSSRASSVLMRRVSWRSGCVARAPSCSRRS